MAGAVDDAAPVEGLAATQEGDIGDLRTVDVCPSIEGDGERIAAAVVLEPIDDTDAQFITKLYVSPAERVTGRRCAGGRASSVDHVDELRELDGVMRP